MDFVAVDVETANVDMASICQLGIARYRGGTLAGEWKSYIDPEDWFDPGNVSIHGIDAAVVQGAPTFPEVADDVHSLLLNEVVVCHTHFDRVALSQAAERYGVALPECMWLDSARVVRRTWASCAEKGYGLENVCQMLGYDFQHHDALEDAKAAAFILLEACKKTGLGITDWIERVRKPIDLANAGSGSAIAREGNPEGALHGEVLVFTGSLAMPRREAADLAASLGCEVAPGVTKRTTLLVVGDQDIRRLAGHEKSSKHRKAEALIAKGVPIRILRETDFRALVREAK